MSWRARARARLPHRRHLPLLGYLALTIAGAVAFYFGTPGSAHKIRAEEQARIEDNRRAIAAIELEAERRCLENQANRQALRAIILRGRDVGKPGTPGFDYYREHPEEAELARQRVDEALADLPAIAC